MIGQLRNATIISFVFFVTASVTAQITTTKIPDSKSAARPLSYDSTKNYLGKDFQYYVGQELYVLGKPTEKRAEGYEDFYKSIPKVKELVSPAISNYDTYNGKYFTVLRVFRPKEYDADINSQIISQYKQIFELADKGTGEKVYFIYDEDLEEFPFLVVGYFDKMKKRRVGQEFVFKNKTVTGRTNIVTGTPVTAQTGQLWKCVDVTLNEETYWLSLIFQNAEGEKIMIASSIIDDRNDPPRYSFQTPHPAFTKQEADNYIALFGKENFDSILNNEIKIGMTPDMCKMVWGEPQKINQTTTVTGTTQQLGLRQSLLIFRRRQSENNPIVSDEKKPH